MTLTKIQLNERANRKHRRLMMRYGITTPAGARPRATMAPQQPIFKPMPVHMVSDFLANLRNNFNRIFGRKVPDRPKELGPRGG